MLKSIGLWIWGQLSSKAGATAILGIVLSIVTFFVGKWWDRPNIKIEIASLSQQVPEEVTVFMPTVKEFDVLGIELDMWFLRKKPEIYRIFKQPFPIRAPGQPGMLLEPARFPLSLSQLSISELRQFHDMCVLLPADLIGTAFLKDKEVLKDFSSKHEQEETALEKLRKRQKELDKAHDQWKLDNPKAPPGYVPPGFNFIVPGLELRELAFNAGAAELKRHLEEHARLEKMAENLIGRNGKLADAEKKINELEAALNKAKGIFTAEVIITNSGGRPLSLLPPVKLSYLEIGHTGHAEMMIQPRSEPIIILPNESKRITLRSHRIDRHHKNDQNREKMQERFGSTQQCELEFHTSDGGTMKSDPITFAQR